MSPLREAGSRHSLSTLSTRTAGLWLDSEIDDLLQTIGLQPTPRGFAHRRSGVVVHLRHWPQAQENLLEEFERSACSVVPTLRSEDRLAVAMHRCTIDLTTTSVGGEHLVGAAAHLELISDLLAQGGCGAIVLTAGLAHGSQRWQELRAAVPPVEDHAGRSVVEPLIAAFVHRRMVDDEGWCYTRGAHGLGAADIAVRRKDDGSDGPMGPAELLAFELSNPDLAALSVGTIRPTPTGPRLAKSQRTFSRYPNESPMFNEFGERSYTFCD